MKTIHYILIILVVFPCSLLAQKTKVYGTVKDATTGESLPFVNVFFKDSKVGTTTNMDGEYLLESYYATDSLSATFVGYEKTTIFVEKDKSQEINILLKESTNDLPELVVLPSDENPAHPILRKVINNKKINDREKLDTYQYEVYNKVEIDINNLSDRFKKHPAFKKFNFIFENIDSTGDKPFLPLFVTEALSDYYFRKDPKSQKEFIKATKVSGVENESVSQFMGDMYQQLNIYDNRLPLFGKDFISPIANNGLGYYKYYLMDSLNIDGYWCYEMQFKPKRIGELTLEGTMWIHDTTYAVKKINATMAEDANVNLVQEASWQQSFEQVEDEVWMLVKDNLFVSFELMKNQTGFYGRKSTSYKDFVINQPQSEEFYKGVENIVVLDSAQYKDDDFWVNRRHDSLTENQIGVYKMIDTLENLPIVKSYVSLIQTLATGYKVLGKIELGPYFSLASYNPVEGNRFSLGMRTSNSFSKMIEISGYAAYGLVDKEFKYGAGTRFFITKKPRRLVKLIYKHDVEQIGLSTNAFSNQNIVSSFARRNPLNKLVFNTEYRASYEREWFPGFSSTVLFRNSSFSPLGITTFYKEGPNAVIDTLNNITTSEISFYTRFAFKEEYVSGEFDRISLGTKHPTIYANYSYGIPNVLNSQYEYHKLLIGYKHKFSLGILGVTRYEFSAGKIWGKLPYPLLEIHPGNETWSYNESTYNMMNINEFVSDEYINFKVQHHFGGLFLNKFPLIRKLKWREVATLSGVWGRMNDQNKILMMLPAYTTTLQDKPYMEGAVGIENIFSFLRFDVVWRLNYLNHEIDGIKVSPVGFRGKFQFEF